MHADTDSVTIGDVTIFRNKKLGTGMFGCVFEGRFQDNPCAVKVLQEMSWELLLNLPPDPNLGVQEGRLNSFIRECKSLLALKHPNIVELFNIHEYPLSDYQKTKLPCIVMELLDCNLAKYLDNFTVFTTKYSTFSEL